MTDTGQIPGEGQPENAGGRLGHPHPADVHTPPADAGFIEQPPPGAAPYPYLDPHETGGEEDDLLLMPGAQGAWSEQQAQYQQPSAGLPPHGTHGTHGTYEGGVPVPAAAEYAGAQLPEHPGVAPQAAEPQPQPQSPGQPLGRPQPVQQSQPQPAAVRRPLHMGPPVPESSNGVVRSLADRGPAAARHGGGSAPHVEPPVTEPEPEPELQPEYPMASEQPASGEFMVGAAADYANAPEYAAGPQYFAVQPEEPPLPGPQLADIPQPGEAWNSAPPPAPQQLQPEVQPEPMPAPAPEPVHAETVGLEEEAPAPESAEAPEAPDSAQGAEMPPAPMPAEYAGPSQGVAPESADTPPAGAAIPAQGGAPVMEPAHVPAPHTVAQGADAAMAEEPVVGIPAQIQPGLAPEQLDAQPDPAPDAVPGIPAQMAHEALTTTAEPAPAAEPAPVAEQVPVEQAPVADEATTSAEETPRPVAEQPADTAEPVAVDPGHSIVTDDQPQPAEATEVAEEPAVGDAVAESEAGTPASEADVVEEAPQQEQAELPQAEAAPEEAPQPESAPEESVDVETAAVEPTPEPEHQPEPEPVVEEAPEATAEEVAVTPADATEAPATEAPATEAPEPAVEEAVAPEAAGSEAELPEAETPEAVVPEAEVPEAGPEKTPQPAESTPAEAEAEADADGTGDADGTAEAGPGAQPEAAARAEEPAPGTDNNMAVDDAEDTADPTTAEDEIADGEPEAPLEPLGPPAEGYAEAERAAVHRVMRERRDIRNGFRSDAIPHEVLLRVLEAAHTAPSVGHSQPWDFVVIRSEETRRTMHELAMRQREAYAKSLPKGRAKQFKELKIEAILETPVNIVVTADPTRGGRHTLGRHTQPQMAPYSSALAVENLWLAARAEGLGVGWVSFFDEREMVRALGLPEHLEVVAYLCVGYVDEFPDEPELMRSGWSKRRPLSWVVHEETYGRRALPGEDPHNLLQETLQGIRPLDAKALGEAWERQKRMTKPSGALGMLEIISAQLSGLSRQCPPPIPEPAAVAIFAGDHGVHAQGVTAWPQEVTGQMVANFLGGGAVCNAFASQVGAEVCVVDVGVASDLPSTPGLLPRKVRAGTGDFTTGPALSREEVLRALEVGIETARDLVAAGNKALLTGEMGIANTTVSAALIAVYTGVGPAEVTGRGTGINDEMHARKIDVVRRGLELHQPDPADPIGVLSAFGGLEHAAMAGLLLGGASLRTPVILDGVSAGAAALVARAIAPEVLAACIAGHRSAEPGHVAALNKLGLRPLVDLDLRLGEGTGALLALPVVQSAARAMHEVATFDSAGVTEKN